MGEGGILRNGLLINKLFYAVIVSLSLRQFLLYMLKKLKAAISLKNSESNPPLPIVNAVFKYLRQLLDTSFGVATLPTSCKIE